MTVFSEKRWFFRKWLDVFARYSISLGGLLVIVSVALIMFFLIGVTAPTFKEAKVEKIASDMDFLPKNTVSVRLLQDSGDLVAITDDGKIVFYQLPTDAIKQISDKTAIHRFLEEQQPQIIKLDLSSQVTAMSSSQENYALGLENGQVLLFNLKTEIKKENFNQKDLKVMFPFGREELALSDTSIKKIRIQVGNNRGIDLINLATIDAEKNLHLKSYELNYNPFTDVLDLNALQTYQTQLKGNINNLLLNQQASRIYLVYEKTRGNF